MQNPNFINLATANKMDLFYGRSIDGIGSAINTMPNVARAFSLDFKVLFQGLPIATKGGLQKIGQSAQAAHFRKLTWQILPSHQGFAEQNHLQSQFGISPAHWSAIAM